MQNQPTTKKPKTLKFIISIVAFIAIVWYLFGGGIEKQAAKDMAKIENQVALDAEKQYKIAKKQGDKMQTYVQASLVAAAYLQAKDEANYNKWKEIENKHAKEVGMK